METAEIKLNNTVYPNGYNITSGGYSHEISEETKQKIRQKLLGVKHTEERRLKQSLAKRGKPTWNKGKKMDWPESRRQQQADIGLKSLHTRWHTNRNIVKNGCKYCEL